MRAAIEASMARIGCPLPGKDTTTTTTVVTTTTTTVRPPAISALCARLEALRQQAGGLGGGLGQLARALIEATMARLGCPR